MKEKEEAILRAALKIFSEKGYSAATTSEIAKEAKVAEGTIFRYFKTKKQILIGIMTKFSDFWAQELLIERVGKILEESKNKSDKEILKDILKDRLLLIEEKKEIMMVIFTEIQFHEDLRALFIENIIKKGMGITEGFFKERIKRGEFKDIDIRIIIRSFVGMLFTYVFQKNMMPEIIQESEDKQIDDMLEIFLNGIRRP